MLKILRIDNKYICRGGNRLTHMLQLPINFEAFLMNTGIAGNYEALFCQICNFEATEMRYPETLEYLIMVLNTCCFHRIVCA